MVRRARGKGRVAVVSHAFYPSVGGSERYHLFTARSLLDRAEVEVFTSDLNLGDPSAPRTASVDGLPVHYLPSRSVEAERFVRPAALFAALRRFDPDVVWGNHPSPTADAGAAFALATRRAWVATYHADVSTNSRTHRAYLRSEMRLLRRADRVIVTSEGYRSTLGERGIPLDRIVAVPTGPYIGNGTVPSASPGRSGDTPGAPFLFVGALDRGHAYKRLDVLLRATQLAGQRGVPLRVEVVGDGDLRPEMERLTTSLGISDRVTFLGRLPDPELADRFAGARALVLPATTAAEGFGTVGIEAVQYGCPLITSSRVGVGALLAEDGAAWTFDADRPETLTDRMMELERDPAARRSLSVRALAAAPKYTWSKLLPRITAPVEAILSDVPVSGR